MFVIIFFWVALFVSVANLETIGKKENNEPPSKLYNGAVKIILNFTNTLNICSASKKKQV